MSNAFISSVWDFPEIGSTQSGYLTHDFLRWYGKLIPQLVSRLLDMYTLEDDLVLANFSGSGTVCLEAHLANRNAIGIDANPLALLLSKVKSTPAKFESKRIIDLLDKYDKKNNGTKYKKDIFLQKWFSQNAYEDLVRYFEAAKIIEDEKLRNTITLAIASIVKKVSRVDSRCVNHIVVDNHKKPVDVRKSLLEKLESMSKDIDSLESKKSKAKVKIEQGDARKLSLKNNSVDFIISHPPYLGAIDYTNIFQLENLMLENDNKLIDINDISTTSMKNYLGSMQKVFDEMYRVLKPGKFVAVVIGDNRKDGNIQPTFSYFIQDATSRLGLELKDIFVWVTKGKAGMNVKRRGNFIDHNYILIFKKL
jgi:site-specific DNA-methyltransferase (cytosine-N4-specific)